MSAKKKLLFVMNHLHCGGAEKSLIALLQSIDYGRTEVDLLLLKHEGILMSKIPRQVNLLAEPELYRYFDMPIKQALLGSLRRGRLDLVWARLRAGMLFRTESNAARREQLLWNYSSRALGRVGGEYDAAVGFLEKTPIYVVMDKVNARRKLGFIHSDYDRLGMDPALDRKHFAGLDYIVSVSDESVRTLQKRFPVYKDKIVLMHNIVSPSQVVELSREGGGETAPGLGHGIMLASVGRLHPAKGFDLAAEACELLVRDGYDIRWYIVGEGEERRKLEQMIREKRLQAHLVLTGLKENPYPYIKQCDIYVQTSLFEGRCLTVTEAKILKKPIVSTNFEAVHDQLLHERNGLIVERDAASIYQGVKRLIDDRLLRERFVHNLAKEELGTEHEIRKLYQWIS